MTVFVLVVLLALQAVVAPTPAYARYSLDETWGDKIGIEVGQDGVATIEQIRSHNSSPDKRPHMLFRWGLAEPGTDFGPGTYTEFEAGELSGDDSLLPYREAEDVDSLLAGEYCFDYVEGRESIAMRPINSNDDDARYYMRYRLGGAVRRWSDTGEIRLRLWTPSRNQYLSASYSLLIPRAEDTETAATADDVYVWEHSIYDWDAEEQVYARPVKETVDGYVTEDRVYLTEGIDQELRALLPAENLSLMETVSQERREVVFEQEESLAEAQRKEREEEWRRSELQREEEERARERRLMFEIPLALVVTAALTLYCVIKASHMRRDYEQSHLAGVLKHWCRRILAPEDTHRRKWSRRRRDEPNDDPVSQLEQDMALLRGDIHPLVAGWVLTRGHLAYSAIVATLARLATIGVVHIDTVDVTTTRYDINVGFSDYAGAEIVSREWILILHRERYALVSDALDRAVLDMLDALADKATEAKSVQNERAFYVAEGTTCLLLSDMMRMLAWHSGTYGSQMASLLGAVRNACHARGLDDDSTTESQRLRLKRMTIVYTVTLMLLVVLFMYEQPLIGVGLFFVPLFVTPYLLSVRGELVPLSDEAVHLSSELGQLARWAENSGAEGAQLEAQEWERILLYAMLMGDDTEAAHHMQRIAPSLTWDANVRAIFKWCGAPSRAVIATFVETTRHLQRRRDGLPAPSPFF